MKKIFLSLFAFIIFKSIAQVVPNVDWIQNFSSTSNPSLVSIANALDANNKVYSTGYIDNGTNKDLIVLAYDSLGNTTFTVSYDNGGDDIGNAITFDNAGNVYVAGESFGSITTQKDYVVMKISPTGSVVWTKRFNGSIGNDVAKDIRVDASGNVYCTGTAFVSITAQENIVTIKYSSIGTQLWVANTGGIYSDAGIGLILSSNNNTVYVAGNYGIGAGTTDIIVQALNASSGSANWTYTTSGTGSFSDECRSIILAGANVVICGLENNLATGNDYFTVKINGTNGAQIFKQSYSYSSVDVATDLVRDSTGNIVVTGKALNGSYFEYHTLFYDSTGTQIWLNKETTLSGSGFVEPKIACDTIANHFYVCGEKLNATNDIFVYQITPGGNTSWRRSVNGSGNNFDFGSHLAVNGIGEVYVSALTTNTAFGYDISTVKISQTPVYWPIDFNNANEPYSTAHYFYRHTGEILTTDTVAAVASEVVYYTKHTYPQQYLLNNHNLAFVISRSDTTYNLSAADTTHRVDLEFFHCNPLTEAYNFDVHDSDGVLNYFLGQLNSPITGVKGSTRLMVPNIYPYIDLHYYSNSSGLKMYFVVKPGAGSSMPFLKFNGASSTTVTGGNQLQINTTLGSFQFEAPQAYWVDPLLNTYSVTSSWNPYGGDMYGISTGTYNQAWPLIIQINQGPPNNQVTQNIEWSTYLGGGIGDYIYRAHSDGNNNLYVAGESISTNFPQALDQVVHQSTKAGGYDGILTKFKPNGVLEWSTYIGGGSSDRINDFDFDNDFGQIYSIGFTSSFNLNTIPKTGAYNDNTFGGGYGDGFIFQVDMASGGISSWVSYYGKGGDDELRACKVDANGEFFIVGSSSSTDLPLVGPVSSYQQAFNVAQQSQLPAIDMYDGIIMHFAAQTSVLDWATYYGTDTKGGGAGWSLDDLYGIDIDGSGVYVCGYSGGINLPGSVNSKVKSSYNDGIIAKFTTAGALSSAKYTNGNDVNLAIKYKGGRVYACGEGSSAMTAVNSGDYYYDGTASGSDAVFNVHNASNFASAIHATFLGGSSTDLAMDLQFGPYNVFYISGGTSSSNFPTTNAIPNTYNQNYNGSDDYFLAAFKQGVPSMLWGTYIGGNEGETSLLKEAAVMAIDGNNHLHLCGASSSSSSFPLDNGGGPPVYFQGQKAGGVNDQSDGTITRFDLTNINTYVGIQEQENRQNVFAVYPNPSSQAIVVAHAGSGGPNTTYAIYNVSGQCVAEGNIPAGENKKVNVSSLAPGLYILNLRNGSQSYSAKFIKVND